MTKRLSKVGSVVIRRLVIREVAEGVGVFNA